jgi:tripeptidyl-peptidase I
MVLTLAFAVAVYRARPGRPVYTAGGGFSYYFKRPKYQDDSVPAYIKNTVNPLGYDGLFDPEGRGYPDIAGQALNYSTYYNGTLKPISGTSMSTPLIGAIMALVNDALVAKGKPTLGFINVSTVPCRSRCSPLCLRNLLSPFLCSCGD